MRNLFLLYNKLNTFYLLLPKYRMLFAEAFIITALVRLAVLFVSFKKLVSITGMSSKPLPIQTADIKNHIIKEISWTVAIVSRHTPWQSKCLVQALTAQLMLRRRKINGSLHLGITRDKNSNPVAHAWFKCGEITVTGGSGLNELTEVAKFYSK